MLYNRKAAYIILRCFTEDSCIRRRRIARRQRKKVGQVGRPLVIHELDVSAQLGAHRLELGAELRPLAGGRRGRRVLGVRFPRRGRDQVRGRVSGQLALERLRHVVRGVHRQERREAHLTVVGLGDLRVVLIEQFGVLRGRHHAVVAALVRQQAALRLHVRLLFLARRAREVVSVL